MDHVLTVEKLFAERLLRVPDYQRGYAWEKQQLTEFIEDVELLPSGKDHYTGTIVFHGNAGQVQSPCIDEEGCHYTTLAVVDGQQRLTTLVLFLDAIRREMSQIEPLLRLAEGIRRSYISVRDQAGQPIYKLLLNRDCREFFIHNVLSDSPGPDGPSIQSHRRLIDARSHFAEYLAIKGEELGSDYKTWLVALRNKLVNQLKVTVYTVEDHAEVGVIFEVLNNRRKPLSELEKVKNYLLYLASKLEVPLHQLAEEVNQAWTNIFERLMDAGLASSSDEDQLLRAHWLMGYDHLRKNWEGSKSIKAKFGLKGWQGKHKELLEELLQYTWSLKHAALAYCDASRPTRSGSFAVFQDDPALRKPVVRMSEKLRRIKVIAPFLPLLMATRLRFAEDAQKYFALVALCEVFAFRVYRFLEKRSNAGQSALFRMGRKLYSGERDFDSVLQRIRSWLLYYCPNEKFQFSEDDNEWYGWFGLKYFLYEYEEHLAKDDIVQLPWDVLDHTDLQKSIEHILPQTPTDPYWTQRFSEAAQRKWTHDIANLCLTSHNPSYGNKPFPDKKGSSGALYPCYANSNLFMERALAAFPDWDEAALTTRRKAIIEWALKRWHVEEPASVELEAGDEQDDTED